VSRRLTVIIALGAIVVAIAAYIIVRNLPEKPVERVTYDRWTHFDVRTSDLAYIDFLRGDNDRLTFEKVEREVDGETTEKWVVTHPEINFEPKTSAISDFTFTFANIYSENLIEEDPEDLSVYGLDDPAATLTVRTKEGEEVQIYIGSQSPTGVAYYIQVAGDPAVYTLRKYTVDKVFTKVDDLRDKTIPVPDPQALTYLKLYSEQSGETIEVVPIDDDDRVSRLATTSAFKIIQPYRTPRPVDTQRFDETMQKIPPTFTIIDFIDDDPDDLSVYGLDTPRYEFEMRDANNASVHLFFGEEADADHAYAKRADSPEVFTLNKSSLQVLQTDPFTVVEKFLLIVNIQYVERITLTGEGTTYDITIDDTNFDEETLEGQLFYVNGIEIEDELFRKYYQTIIGLYADAENPNPGPYPGSSDVTIQFELNDRVSADSARLDLVQVNKDFYAAYRNGYSEFIVSDYQVEAMFDEAERLLELAEEESE